MNNPSPNCKHCHGTGLITNEGTFTPEEGEECIVLHCYCIDNDNAGCPVE